MFDFYRACLQLTALLPHVCIVLVFKSRAEKKERNSFYLILFMTLLSKMTPWILFEGKMRI